MAYPQNSRKLLTSTVATGLCGKLSDLYGRKPIYLACTAIFLLGSAIAGLSQSMLELIVFRALQGIGGGGLLVLAQTIIGDIVSPRERGRYQGLFGRSLAYPASPAPWWAGSSWTTSPGTGCSTSTSPSTCYRSALPR